jgi:hypothetical protein
MTIRRSLLFAAALLNFAPFAAAQAEASPIPEAASSTRSPPGILAGDRSGGAVSRRIAPPSERIYAQWPFRRGRDSRPVPPRAIPSAPLSRSRELQKAKAPLPRTRPDDITGSIKIVPVAPLE